MRYNKTLSRPSLFERTIDRQKYPFITEEEHQIAENASNLWSNWPDRLRQEWPNLMLMVIDSKPQDFGNPGVIVFERKRKIKNLASMPEFQQPERTQQYQRPRTSRAEQRQQYRRQQRYLPEDVDEFWPQTTTLKQIMAVNQFTDYVIRDAQIFGEQPTRLLFSMNGPPERNRKTYIARWHIYALLRTRRD